jgi:hypothetical protein
VKHAAGETSAGTIFNVQPHHVRTHREHGHVGVWGQGDSAQRSSAVAVIPQCRHALNHHGSRITSDWASEEEVTWLAVASSTGSPVATTRIGRG